MRAHTITISFLRNRPRRRALALALGLCALAIPTSATAQPIDSGYTSVNASDGSNGSSQAGSDYSSVNSIVPPPSQPSGSQADEQGYSTVSAISGPPSDAPTLVTDLPGGTSDGFDWASALVGAGAALAVTALGGAALLTVRRRTTVSPSASIG
jgi:hypothetical protein